MGRVADKIANVKTPDLYTGEPPLQSAHNTWKQVKTDLAYALGPNVHRSWTGRLHITQADESVVTLSAPAMAVARQVASQCGAGRAPQYNPIVIHGTNGMGKTHLLYAIENAVRDSHPNKRMRFITAEDFVSTFVASVRGQTRDGIAAFKASLREVDLLVIDDVHFIADKPGSQEELLHTLVSLVDSGKQILIAADRHPDKIDKATDRLKSYMSSGLVCKIGAADYELRLRILDRLIARRRAGGQQDLAIPQNARDHLAARMNATPADQTQLAGYWPPFWRAGSYNRYARRETHRPTPR